MWYEEKREFIEAAARVMWADAWAGWQESHCEECGAELEVARESECTAGARRAEHRGASFSGCELTDVAPPTPQYALYEAAALLGKLEAANRLPLASLLRAAGHADYVRNGRSGEITHWPFDALCDCTADAADFGGDIALQALGHGAGWFDNHARFELKIPSIEFDYQDG